MTIADEAAQDYVLALDDELAALDKDIQTLLRKRHGLFETRERLLANMNVSNTSQPERRRKRAGNP
jgi:hypothetical protein